LSATVEDDIDAALEDALGDVFSDAKIGQPTFAVKNHLEGTHPVPSNLIEKV
jgi:hypothetical protein